MPNDFFTTFKTQKEKITQLKTRRISQYQVPTNKRRNEIELNNQNHVIDERDMIMDLVMDITTELDLATVTHRILQVILISQSLIKTLSIN